MGYKYSLLVVPFEDFQIRGGEIGRIGIVVDDVIDGEKLIDAEEFIVVHDQPRSPEEYASVARFESEFLNIMAAEGWRVVSFSRLPFGYEFLLDKEV